MSVVSCLLKAGFNLVQVIKSRAPARIMRRFAIQTGRKEKAEEDLAEITKISQIESAHRLQNRKRSPSPPSGSSPPPPPPKRLMLTIPTQEQAAAAASSKQKACINNSDSHVDRAISQINSGLLALTLAREKLRSQSDEIAELRREIANLKMEKDKVVESLIVAREAEIESLRKKLEVPKFEEMIDSEAFAPCRRVIEQEAMEALVEKIKKVHPTLDLNFLYACAEEEPPKPKPADDSSPAPAAIVDRDDRSVAGHLEEVVKMLESIDSMSPGFLMNLSRV